MPTLLPAFLLPWHAQHHAGALAGKLLVSVWSQHFSNWCWCAERAVGQCNGAGRATRMGRGRNPTGHHDPGRARRHSIPLICPMKSLHLVFVFKKKQKLFLIFACIWCNQITPTTEAHFLPLGTLKLLLNIYFSTGLSASNYFVLMLREYVESVPPLIPATCWVYCIC